MTEPSAAALPAETDQARIALESCPHLRVADGSWHASTPSRSHRCALLEQGRPTLERQRIHCLAAAHVQCPTWLERYGAVGRPPARATHYASTVPVVLEGPGVTLPTERTARRLAGPVTVVVVAAAVGALALSRGPLAPGSSTGGNGVSTPAPAGSAVLESPAPSSPASATPAPSATVAPQATPTPRPTARSSTYRVKAGDTLSSIAARFGTTAKVLAKLNNITNPSLIHPGQVLTLP